MIRRMTIFISSFDVINRLLLSLKDAAKVITFSGVHCSSFQSILERKFLLRVDRKVVLLQQVFKLKISVAAQPVLEIMPD